MILLIDFKIFNYHFVEKNETNRLVALSQKLDKSSQTYRDYREQCTSFKIQTSLQWFTVVPQNFAVIAISLARLVQFL